MSSDVLKVLGSLVKSNDLLKTSEPRAAGEPVSAGTIPDKPEKESREEEGASSAAMGTVQAMVAQANDNVRSISKLAQDNAKSKQPGAANNNDEPGKTAKL